MSYVYMWRRGSTLAVSRGGRGKRRIDLRTFIILLFSSQALSKAHLSAARYHHRAVYVLGYSFVSPWDHFCITRLCR